MEDFKKIDFRQNRDFGDVLGISFTFIKQNAKQLFKAIIYLVGPPVLIGALLMGSFMANILSNSMHNTPPSILSFVNIFLGIILITGGMLFSYAIVMSYIKLYQVTETGIITVREVWTEAKSHLMPLFGLGILVGIVIMVGSIFCYIPGIYLATALAFSFFIMVMEGKDISESFSRSFKLINGHWWSTFGVSFVMSMISGMLMYILLIPIWIISMVIAVHSTTTSQPGGDPEIVGYLFMAYMPILYLGVAILSSFRIIALAFKYFAVVEEKESVGLMGEIAKLDEEENTI